MILCETLKKYKIYIFLFYYYYSYFEKCILLIIELTLFLIFFLPKFAKFQDIPFYTIFLLDSVILSIVYMHSVHARVTY